MNFDRTSVAAPQVFSSSTAKYSPTDREAPSAVAFRSLASTDRCRSASASIKLASTAKPSLPTRPKRVSGSLPGCAFRSGLRRCSNRRWVAPFSRSRFQPRSGKC